MIDISRLDKIKDAELIAEVEKLNVSEEMKQLDATKQLKSLKRKVIVAGLKNKYVKPTSGTWHMGALAIFCGLIKLGATQAPLLQPFETIVDNLSGGLEGPQLVGIGLTIIFGRGAIK